ncbi:unnamed protein product [Prunus armeniaca]|uniref:Uncharacterized protein n=1 Tax=Prunus armeniaca TaxID=36596 RepID=A0A6J5V607_PRUAR|nr:unnamed protein product [Prunus armeniaca]
MKLQDVSTPSSGKPKAKKKIVMSLCHQSDQIRLQFKTANVVEDICGRAEIFSDDREEAEWLSMPLSHLRVLANEIMSL